MKTKLPKQMIVTVENEGDNQNEYFGAHATAQEAAQDGTIKRGGVYVLKELITVETIVKVTPGR